MAGAHGTLGVVTEVALQTLPSLPSAPRWSFPMDRGGGGGDLFSAALATPVRGLGRGLRNGTAWLRIEGWAAVSNYRRDRLLALFSDHRAEVLRGGRQRPCFGSLRGRDPFCRGRRPLWRSAGQKPTDAPRVATSVEAGRRGGSLDWGGGLIWYSGPGRVGRIRRFIAPMPR